MKTIGKLGNLAALGILALAGAGSGCIIQGSSSPPVCYDGAISATWTLTANSQVVECAPGDEVDINAGQSTFTFDCFQHGGTTGALPGGFSYDVSLGLFDSANAPLSQTQTMQLFVPCATTVDIGDVELSLTPL